MTKHVHDDFGGLARDLATFSKLIERRTMLQWLAGASVLPLIGCPSDDSAADGGADRGDGATAGASGNANGGACSVIPSETGGPYPGDGTNGPNVLTLSGVVRSDIRSSFGGLSGTATGVPLDIELTVVNHKASCAPLQGYAVYLWHCDIDGNYSLYTVSKQNYLRGVQASDASGKVKFSSIFPACYSGRWPHIHFEFFPSLDKAASASNRVRTSQLALPEDVCNSVFATEGYSASVSNLQRVTLASDNVFSDGSSTQVPAVTGSVSEGYVAKLTVGLDV